ncbi:hypothetical protein HC776_01285 [bacterium]|nr:hypothetical protein [bacterium]
MARTSNRPAPKQTARDDELRSILSEADEPAADEGDFPIEIGQAIDDERRPRARDGKIFGLSAGERAFVSVVFFFYRADFLAWRCC